ncbi:glycerophosphodiester phosphodiesterase [Tessaracoccus lubricantis]
MAHRGGSFLTANLGIENTIRAFANAVALGFRYLETDVHTTRDGHLVAFHDVTLDRVTDVAGSLRDLSLDELSSLRVGDREPIPTLDELFETFPDINFNIDIKSVTAVQPLVDAIVKHGAERRVCVGSFARTRIRRFRSLLPQVPTAVSPTGVAALTMGVISSGGDVYQVPLEHPVGPVTVDIVTPKNIERIHAAGRRIHVWTVDDPTTMHRLIDWGVDGIVTDRPDFLKDVLRARGMWSTR